MKAVKDMQAAIASLRSIIHKALDLDVLMEAHASQWPSARIAHHRPHMLIAAMEREIAGLELAAQRQAEHEARHAADQERRKYDQFIVDSAQAIGVTPERFLEIQQERRQAMARAAEHEAARKESAK